MKFLYLGGLAIALSAITAPATYLVVFTTAAQDMRPALLRADQRLWAPALAAAERPLTCALAIGVTALQPSDQARPFTAGVFTSWARKHCTDYYSLHWYMAHGSTWAHLVWTWYSRAAWWAAAAIFSSVMLAWLLAIFAWPAKHKTFTRIRSVPPSRLPRRGRVRIGGISLSNAAELYSALLAGTTGAGKSQLLRHCACVARERGDAAIIIDRDGDMLSRLYSPSTDTILNPLDARGVSWSPLAEVAGRAPYFLDHLASLIVPEGGGKIKAGGVEFFFHEAARSVLRAALERSNDNAELVGVLRDPKRLAKAIRGTTAQIFVDLREFGSIVATVINHVQPLEYLPPAGPADWSLRNWIREIDERKSKGEAGFVFVPLSAETLPAVEKLVPVWMSIATDSVRRLSESRTRRICLLADEVGQYGQVSGFVDALTEGRKRGLSVWAGVQSLAQLQATYGGNGARTMLSCFRHVVIFNTPDPQGAEDASKWIGERTVKVTTKQSNGGEATRKEQRRAVTPHDIRSLPNLMCYAWVSGKSEWLKTKVVRCEPPIISAPFVERKFAGAAQQKSADENKPKRNAPLFDPSAILRGPK